MPPVVAVAAFVGSSLGASAALAPLVGGALIGAVAGGAIAASKGQNILKGALKGGLVGAAAGGIGGLVAGGATSAGTTAALEGTGLTGAISGGSTMGFGGTPAILDTGLTTTGVNTLVGKETEKETKQTTSSGLGSFLNSNAGAASIIGLGNALASDDGTEALREEARLEREANLKTAVNNPTIPLSRTEIKNLAPTPSEMIARSQVSPSQTASEMINWSKEAYKKNPQPGVIG